MKKMKLQKIESYEAGYDESSSGTLKKAVAVTAAAALMAGGLTGCAGLCEPQYSGYMSVESVSESDLSPSDACSSEDEMFTLDGDVAYVSSDNG